jgi:hypothetical protein
MRQQAIASQRMRIAMPGLYFEQFEAGQRIEHAVLMIEGPTT